MIKLKFQENIRKGDWKYTRSFINCNFTVKEGQSIDFQHCKLSKQPYEDIVKLAKFIEKFEDFTLIAHTDCSNSINAKKLIEIADQVYIGNKLIKETKMNKSMDMELRIPEDQMQRLEAMVTRIEKSVGPKTWKRKILDVIFGRISILLMVGAYFFMGGENPKVVSFDRANGIVSLNDNGSIQNLIWSDNKLMRDGELFDTKFGRQISNSLLLGIDILGLEDDSSWF